VRFVGFTIRFGSTPQFPVSARLSPCDRLNSQSTTTGRKKKREKKKAKINTQCAVSVSAMTGGTATMAIRKRVEKK